MPRSPLPNFSPCYVQAVVLSRWRATETPAAMAECDEIVKAGRACFASAVDMFEVLEEAGRPGDEDR
ncbi:MAG: hypothetical protein OXE57_00885 [Alphaproteobacteria bacterium]|nr:hypothetical protein [Alphaproteobacteria bacterium]